jgi:signal transduction histidine kinase
MIIIVVLTLFLGLGGTLRARADLTNIGRTELEKRGVTIARNLAVQHADQILVNDIFGLYELVNDLLLSNSDLRYVFIVDPAGTVWVSSFEEGLPRGLKDANVPTSSQKYRVQLISTEEGIIYDIAMPILEGRAGVVRVGMLEKPLQEQVNKQTLQLLTMTGTVTLVGAIIAYFLGTLLTKPLSQLVEVTKAVAKGNLKQKAPVMARDEVGKLALAFNAMTEALARSRQESEEFNRQLLQLNKELQRKEVLRSQLLGKVIRAQEEERKRIARELHDEFAQTLTAFVMSIEAADQALPPGSDQIRERLLRTKTLATQTLEQTRLLILDLRPVVLDDLGLIPAIRWYAERHLEMTGVKVELQVTGTKGRLLPEVETTLFRIIQEAISNVAKHADASHVTISLEFMDSLVTAAIEDDGRGFDVSPTLSSEGKKQCLGFLGMQERATLLGGKLAIESRPGTGTKVLVEIPLGKDIKDRQRNT